MHVERRHVSSLSLTREHWLLIFIVDVITVGAQGPYKRGQNGIFLNPGLVEAVDLWTSLGFRELGIPGKTLVTGPRGSQRSSLGDLSSYGGTSRSKACI